MIVIICSVNQSFPVAFGGSRDNPISITFDMGQTTENHRVSPEMLREALTDYHMKIENKKHYNLNDKTNKTHQS